MVRLARLDENNGVGETITTFRNGQMQTAFVIAYSTSNKYEVKYQKTNSADDKVRITPKATVALC